MFLRRSYVLALSQFGAFSFIKSYFPPPALLSQEREAQSAVEPPSSGPSESELALQEALITLHQEKDSLHAQYQAQVYIILPHYPLPGMLNFIFYSKI